MDLISGSVDQTSSSEAKIALFRSLFRGREDVYPRRFESRKTGRAGYAPACANEWVIGASCSISGSSGYRRSSRYLPHRSVESAEAEVDRLEGSTSASFRASSARAWSLTSSPITAT